MIDINLEEIYADLKNISQYDGLKKQALSQFITFARADMTVQDVMNSVYRFAMEDGKPLIDVSVPHRIMNIFAIKMASIHYGCHIPELDEQVLSIINENMLTQYKDYYNLSDYQNIRCDMINIFISDPLLFYKVSEKARYQDRIDNNSFFDFQNTICSMLINYFNDKHTVSEAFNEFVKECLTKTEHIVKKSIPDKILIYYALKNRCNYMRNQFSSVNQLVMTLALDGVLYKHKECFNESDYEQLRGVEESITMSNNSWEEF